MEAIYNVKYISPDGAYEVIICEPPDSAPYIVSNSVNRGTANYGTDAGIEHFTYDMLPYFAFGNSGYGIFEDFWYDVFNGASK